MLQLQGAWFSRAVLATVIVAFAHCSPEAQLRVDGQLVVKQLTKLATFSDHPNPAVTRILFTPNDMKGRQYVKSLMDDVGLVIREDSVGNIFGHWQGSEPDAGTVLTGSHCDAIPLAGMYDGTLGVIGAIEALAALKASGFKPRRNLEVMMFTSEEPTRFALSCIGSRAMAGALDEQTLASRKDENGTTFIMAAQAVGYGQGLTSSEMLSHAHIKEGKISHFVELHIEQGPLLEAQGVDIGIVTAIAAPAALDVYFYGDGGHAGALLMPYRNDAGLAAAEVALAAEAAALRTGAIDTVATTGVFEIKPGAVNSVPREARLGIDVRDIDGPRRDQVIADIIEAAKSVSEKRKVRYEVKMVNQDPPATCSPEITEATDRAAKGLGLSTMHMVSRAYHDSLFMARIAPTAMIFIPCKNGWSHRPDEFASAKDIANGVQVLALTMAELAGGTWGSASDKSEL